MMVTGNTKKFVVIDYGMGNLQSVGNAFQYLGEDVYISKSNQIKCKSSTLTSNSGIKK